MFNKKSIKKVIITVLALTMILGTVAFAAEGIYTKKLTATYGRIKLNYEGSDVTSQIETNYGTPAFVTEGKSYVPVRAIGDLVGVDVKWDEKTNTAYITDPKVQEHRKQLDEKDMEIAKLKAEIEKLEKVKEEIKEEKKEEEVTKNDIKSLQTSLNNKYKDYKQVQFDVLLKENNNKVTADINTNFGSSRDKTNWMRMRYADKRYLIEEVVAQVRKEFKDVDIAGSIFDAFSKKDLFTFSQSKNGKLSISDKDHLSVGGHNDDYYYNGSYDGYYGGYYGGDVDSRVRTEFNSKGISNAILTNLDHRGRTVSFNIDFPGTYENKWIDLDNDVKRSMLDYISNGIEYDYNNNYNYEYNNDYDYNYGYTDYVEANVYIGSVLLGRYTRDLRYSTGSFTANY